jgi:hypothetical protein
MHLIESAKGCDNMLVYLGTFPAVFDDLKVFVLAGLFSSSKHVEVSLQGHSNITGRLGRKSKLKE